MKLRLLSAFCAFVFTFVVSCAYAEYTITDLGTLGGESSHAWSINDLGQVVGSSLITGSDDYHAFLYNGSTMQDLGTLGGTRSVANSINDSGQVVGKAITGYPPRTSAFLYDGNTMLDLCVLTNCTASGLEGIFEASSINDRGDIVGVGWRNEQTHAFFYDGNTMQDLGTLGGVSSEATGINNSGQIIGTVMLTYDRLRPTHAFLYDSGTMQDLGTLGGDYSGASSINDLGQVVGSSTLTVYEDVDSVIYSHAYLYDGNTMQDLGTLGGTRSAAYDINNSGQIVGTSKKLDNDWHAFLYDGSTMLDLCVLTNCTAKGWEGLTEATSINDRGDITGVGRINGEEHAFLVAVSRPPAHHTFQVTSYTIQLGDKLQATFGGKTIKARGIISCMGPDNQRVVAYFLADDSPVPPPTTTIGGKWGPVFLPKELMGQWTDMLRHEKPVYGYINTDHPEWTNISTREESVGEEEN